MNRLGVCSWSLRPASPGHLEDLVRQAGLPLLQVALDPVRRDEGAWLPALDRIRAAGVEVVSGMWAPAGEDYSTLDSIKRTGGVRDPARWEENLGNARRCGEAARRRGLPLVTFHAGFIPPPGDAERAAVLDRLRRVADEFERVGVRVACETGQETPGSMLAALDELGRPEVGVNFDPANMILYGTSEPVAALRALCARVAQVHIKDAVPAGSPGAWGTEVVAGTGAVDWAAFFALVVSRLPGVNLIVEREAGESRVSDVRAGAAFARAALERASAGARA